MAGGLFRGSGTRSKGQITISLGFGDPLLTGHVLHRVFLPHHDLAATHEALVRFETGCVGLARTLAGLIPLKPEETFAPGHWPNLIIHRALFQVELEEDAVDTRDAHRPAVSVKAGFRITNAEAFVERFDANTVMAQDILGHVRGPLVSAVQRVAEDLTGRDLSTWQSVRDDAHRALLDYIPERLREAGLLFLELVFVQVKWEHGGLDAVASFADTARCGLEKEAVSLRAEIAADELRGKASVDKGKQIAEFERMLKSIDEQRQVDDAEREVRLNELYDELNPQRSPAPVADEMPTAGAPAASSGESIPLPSELYDNEPAGDDGTFAAYLRKATSLAESGHHDTACNAVRQGLDVELKALAAECKTGYQKRFFDALGEAVSAPVTVIQYFQLLARLGNLGSHPDSDTQLTGDDADVALRLGAAVGDWLDAGGRDSIRTLSAEDKQKIRDQCNPRGSNRSAGRSEDRAG